MYNTNVPIHCDTFMVAECNNRYMQLYMVIKNKYIIEINLYFGNGNCF